MKIETIMRVHPLISEALDGDRALVALESTVITHGLRYPENVETALAMEEAVREAGATPATIAIIQGQITIGLTADELEYLGTRPLGAVRKCSRRDIALAAANGEDGGTTVAGTMILAHLAGIEIFATGGIGGVHRGHPYDVSADLSELARTPVTVVCSGAKSILDLPLTREALETNGVPVIGYGTDEMPAFYSRSSGLAVDARMDSPEQVARMIRARQALGIQSGALVTVPVPEEEALDTQEAEEAINQATREADIRNISGPAATPWLLQRVKELTAEVSLKANLALLHNNASVAGAISVVLAELSAKEDRNQGS